MSVISEFRLPTDPADLARIKNAILEAATEQQMIEDRKANIKDIRDSVKDQYELPPSLFNKLVKAHHEHKYDEMTEEHSIFELVYESILGDNSNDDLNDDDLEDVA